MLWTPIQPSHAISLEAELQDLFNNWTQRRSVGWVLAGAPAWLRNSTGPNQRKQFRTSFRYRFTPDVLFEENACTYVIELKLGAKFEPLALAEVLHHAWMLVNDEEVRWNVRGAARSVTPVIIGQQNLWTRAALALLFENGLRRNAVQFLEFDTFLHDGKKVLWLADPFAAWKRVARENVPAELSAEFGERFWYYVAEEDSWVGMDHPCDPRPPLPTEKHVVASRLEDGGFVAWEGAYSEPAWTYKLGT